MAENEFTVDDDSMQTLKDIKSIAVSGSFNPAKEWKQVPLKTSKLP